MTDIEVPPRQEKPKTEVGGLLVDFIRNPGGKPWVTYLAIAACVAIFAYFNLEEGSRLYRRFTEALAPSGVAVWSGAYWGLLTSAFVHIDIWHIFFNVWWLRDFGSLLEPTLGRPKYVLFIIAGAIVSSAAQLALTGETGIGISGVVYAMFGYALAAREVRSLYKQILTKQTIVWLLGWLLLCITLTYTGVWQVGNGAHVAGFLFGYCLANAFTARVWVALNRGILMGLVALTVLSVSYMPWSDTWRNRSAYAEIFVIRDAAEAGNAEAQYNYAVILSRYGKKTEEMLMLRKAAGQGHIPAMNDLAWELATDRHDALRNGKEAIELAEKVCQKNNWRSFEYIDTLAAAYAEAERWNDAIATQKLAISKPGPKDASTKASLESRLEQYLRHEKARE